MPRQDIGREGARIEIPRGDQPLQDGPREVLPPVIPLPLPRTERPEPPRPEPRLADAPRIADPRLADAPRIADPRPEPRAVPGLDLRILPGSRPPTAQVKPLPLDPRPGPSPLQSLFEPPAPVPPPAGNASIQLPLGRPAPRPAQAPPRPESTPSPPPFLHLPNQGRPADPGHAPPPPPRAPAPRPPPPTAGSRDPLGEDTPPTGALPRSWAMGPLPGPRVDPAVVEEDDPDPTTSLTDESADYTDATVAEEPGLIERVVQIFRNDPVTIVMALLAVAIIVILIILLTQTS